MAISKFPLFFDLFVLLFDFFGMIFEFLLGTYTKTRKR